MIQRCVKNHEARTQLVRFGKYFGPSTGSCKRRPLPTLGFLWYCSLVLHSPGPLTFMLRLNAGVLCYCSIYLKSFLTIPTNIPFLSELREMVVSERNQASLSNLSWCYTISNHAALFLNTYCHLDFCDYMIISLFLLNSVFYQVKDQVVSSHCTLVPNTLRRTQ